MAKIKGLVVLAWRERVERLQQSGELSQERLEEELSTEAMALLDKAAIQDFGWYEIEPLAEVTRLVARTRNPEDVEGELRKLGREAAQALVESGAPLAQLQRMSEGISKRSIDALILPGRLVLTLSASVLDFSDWTLVEIPGAEDRFQIRVEDAAALPESSVVVSCGYCEYIISQMSEAAVEVVSSRPNPDTVELDISVDWGAPANQ